jgi:hypothetical protein
VVLLRGHVNCKWHDNFTADPSSPSLLVENHCRLFVRLIAHDANELGRGTSKMIDG